jgi:hypothetical protein
MQMRRNPMRPLADGCQIVGLALESVVSLYAGVGWRMYIEVYKVADCTLYANPQFPGIAIEGNGYVSSEIFRDMGDHALALLAESGTHKLLVDVEDMVNISFADPQWAIRTWVPRLIEARLTHAAIINSRHYFHRVAVDAIVNTISPKQLHVRYFDDRTPAENWLQSV